jgi:murein DD-endopeptidase MepM/ murein hydrolase activator NlpD
MLRINKYAVILLVGLFFIVPMTDLTRAAFWSSQAEDANASTDPDLLDETTYVIADNFDDNSMNPTLWSLYLGPTGPTASEVNQRLEITFPSTSQGSIFWAGYKSKFLLKGDFDIQVDYALIDWQLKSGVRVGLANQLITSWVVVERAGFADGDVRSGEAYVTHFPGSIVSTLTTDMAGKLRLERIGTTLTGYYFNAAIGDWTAIHSVTTTNDDVEVILAAWSHDQWFIDQDIRVAFDNFVINKGTIIWPNPPERFLELPFSYTNHHSLALDNWHKKPYGKISSWFDHDIPTLPVTFGNGKLILNSGEEKSKNPDLREDFTCYEDPAYCYDDHDAYDFGLPGGSEIVASADGVVHESGCGIYGYQVVIKHPNNYFTLYGHLRDSPSLSQGQSVLRGQSLGIMGGTARKYDEVKKQYYCTLEYSAHLHFGVYYDANADGNWSAEEVVDPSNWYGPYIDPVIAHGYPTNFWLWEFDRDRQSSCSNLGCLLMDLGEEITINIPSGYLTNEVLLSLYRGPGSPNPPQSLFSIGYAFLLRVFNTDEVPDFSPLTQPNYLLDDPIETTIEFSDEAIQHFDESNLALYWWNESDEEWEILPSNINTEDNILNAETFELGQFDVLAPVLCPEDPYIYDDSYFGAAALSTDGSSEERVFDFVDDEDWFNFNATAGLKYQIETVDSAQDVGSKIELFDQDGITLLAWDDNEIKGDGSSLTWVPSESGTYFIRVSPLADSAFGCDASYDINVRLVNQWYLYLPFSIR